LSFLCNFALEYDVRRVQAAVNEWNCMESNQLLICADVNLLHRNINIMEKNTEILLQVTEKVGTEIIADKIEASIIKMAVREIEHVLDSTGSV